MDIKNASPSSGGVFDVADGMGPDHRKIALSIFFRFIAVQLTRGIRAANIGMMSFARYGKQHR